MILQYRNLGLSAGPTAQKRFLCRMSFPRAQKKSEKSSKKEELNDLDCMFFLRTRKNKIEKSNKSYIITPEPFSSNNRKGKRKSSKSSTNSPTPTRPSTTAGSKSGTRGSWKEGTGAQALMPQVVVVAVVVGMTPIAMKLAMQSDGNL